MHLKNETLKRYIYTYAKKMSSSKLSESLGTAPAAATTTRPTVRRTEELKNSRKKDKPGNDNKKVKEIYPSDRFWIYGPRKWDENEFRQKTNNRKAILDVTSRIKTTEQLYTVIYDVCNILNSKTPLSMGRISRIKSRHARITNGGCKFGLTCQKGINQPGCDHNHGHTVSEYIFFYLVRMLYDHTTTVAIHDEGYNDYNVSDDDEDKPTARTYTYYMPQYKPKIHMRAIPKANADPHKIIDVLSTKWVSFIAGHDSMVRFGATEDNRMRSTKWCTGPICVNYLDTKTCPLKHDDDVVVVSQLLRSLVTIERVPKTSSDSTDKIQSDEPSSTASNTFNELTVDGESTNSTDGDVKDKTISP